MQKQATVQLILLIFAALVYPPTAWAHGSGPIIIFEERQAGPYLLSVYGDLDVEQGTLFVDTLVGDQPAPADTTVNVRATPPSDGQPLSVAAQADTASRLYVASIPFTVEGPWQFEILIEGPAGSGRISFEAEVVRPPPAWTSLIAPVGIGIALVVFFIVTLKRQREIE